MVAAAAVVVAAAVDFLQWLGRILRPRPLQKSPRVRPRLRPVLWFAAVVAVGPTAVGSIAVAVTG